MKVWERDLRKEKEREKKMILCLLGDEVRWLGIWYENGFRIF